MELVTGHIPTDKNFTGDMDMVRWVQTLTSSSVPLRDELFDGALKPLTQNEESSMLEVLDIALQCTCAAPTERPSSRKVSDLLLHVLLKIHRIGSMKKM